MREHVRVVDVGPRDGLQNEKQVIATEIKLALIDRLAAAFRPSGYLRWRTTQRSCSA